MAALTNFAENKIIDALFRGQALGAPATWHAALFTSDPTETGGGTEVTGGSYARVAITASLANFAGTQAAGSTTASSGTTGTTSNNIVISFPAPSASWGIVSHVALMDASTGGNAWVYQVVTSPVLIGTVNNTVTFQIGAFTFQIDN